MTKLSHLKNQKAEGQKHCCFLVLLSGSCRRVIKSHLLLQVWPFEGSGVVAEVTEFVGVDRIVSTCEAFPGDRQK